MRVWLGDELRARSVLFLFWPTAEGVLLSAALKRGGFSTAFVPSDFLMDYAEFEIANRELVIVPNGVLFDPYSYFVFREDTLAKQCDSIKRFAEKMKRKGNRIVGILAEPAERYLWLLALEEENVSAGDFLVGGSVLPEHRIIRAHSVTPMSLMGAVAELFPEPPGRLTSDLLFRAALRFGGLTSPVARQIDGILDAEGGVIDMKAPALAEHLAVVLAEGRSLEGDPLVLQVLARAHAQVRHDLGLAELLSGNVNDLGDGILYRNVTVQLNSWHRTGAAMFRLTCSSQKDWRVLVFARVGRRLTISFHPEHWAALATIDWDAHFKWPPYIYFPRSDLKTAEPPDLPWWAFDVVLASNASPHAVVELIRSAIKDVG